MQLNTDKINKELEQMGWSYVDLARKTGCAKQWVHWKLNNSQSGTTFRTVEKFAKALGVEPKDLIK